MYCHLLLTKVVQNLYTFLSPVKHYILKNVGNNTAAGGRSLPQYGGKKKSMGTRMLFFCTRNSYRFVSA